MADFFLSITFSEKTAFLQIQLDFVTGFEKFFYPSESSSDKDANRCKVVPEIYAKKNKSQNQLDVFLCY